MGMRNGALRKIKRVLISKRDLAASLLSNQDKRNDCFTEASQIEVHDNHGIDLMLRLGDSSLAQGYAENRGSHEHWTNVIG